ncbi:SIR2 family NAD-dependent protein deacylase [Nocardia asiatica]
MRQRIHESRHISVLTGAGISTDSGIPDFSGTGGLWTADPGAERTATIGHYRADPELRRREWTRRAADRRTAVPNPGHHALVELERAGKLDTLITQNIDGLHLAAGTSPERLVEIHGNDRAAVCLECSTRLRIELVLERVCDGDTDPRCACGGVLKSRAVSFGQDMDRAALARADAAARRAELFIAVGSSQTVFPASGLVPVAAISARVVIVNGEATMMDEVADLVVRGSISVILPQLVAGLSPERAAAS